MRQPDAETEDRLLIEQRVDHPVRPKTGNQFLRHAIDTALAADILAHHRDLAMFQHQIAQRPVDQPAHDLRLFHRLEIAAEGLRTCFRQRSVGSPAGPLRGNETCHHFFSRLQPWPRDRFFRHPFNPFAGFMIDRECCFRLECAGLGQQPHRVQQRIVCLLGFDFLTFHVGGGNIRPGMAIEPHGAHVQEGRAPPLAHIVGCFPRSPIGVVQVEAVAGEIFKPRPVFERCPDPALRRLYRNADAVVFADEQQWQRDRLIGCPLRGVEGPLRGGMVSRSIAEGA